MCLFIMFKNIFDYDGVVVEPVVIHEARLREQSACPRNHTGMFREKDHEARGGRYILDIHHQEIQDRSLF